MTVQATTSEPTPTETCEHRWCCITPAQGPDATYGCFYCPEERKGHEIGLTADMVLLGNGQPIHMADPICRAQGYCPTTRACSC